MAWAGVGRREMRDENREAGDARREKEDGRGQTAERQETKYVGYRGGRVTGE